MGGTRAAQFGKAAVTTTAGSMDLYANVTIQGVKGSQTWATEEVQDFEGFDAAWLARNEHVEIKVNVKLTGTSKANAIAGATFLLPLSAVVLSGFDLPWLNAAGISGPRYTGNWQLREGTAIDLTNDKTGGAEITLRKYADPTQNTAATTAAS